ncbi:MAG TPA: glycosyltransferase [Spirochaetota bacterium]|nr:glycosyltransferase [Spirochaetota bacterium]
MKRKKIALIIPSIYGGGAERNLLILAGALKATYEVDIITLESGAQYETPHGVSTVNLTGISGRSSFFLKALLFPLQWMRLKRLLKRKQYDIVIGYLERVCLLLSLIRLREPCPKKIFSFRVYQSLHIIKEELPLHIKVLRNPVYKRFIRRSQRYTDRIVVPGKGVKDDLERFFGLDPSGIEVVYYGYQQELMRRLSSEPLMPEIEDFLSRGPLITTVGRLAKQKGQWHLIRVFTEVRKKMPGSRLLILGEGPLKGCLVRLAEDLGNRVCGAPVVSADCRAGPREVLAPGTDIRRETKEPEFAEYGVLMPTFDDRFYSAGAPLSATELIWADTLFRMLLDKGLRQKYTNKSKERVKDFTLEKFSLMWGKILDKVLKS